MKKDILVASLLTFTLIGCGGGGSSDSNKDVEFKTSGKYDLKEYIFPDKNQTNMYVEKTYINSDGKKEFNDDNLDSTEYPPTDFIHEGTIVKEYADHDLDTMYQVLNDRIKMTDVNDDINVTFDVARFADIGDYILNQSKSFSSNGSDVNMTRVCKLDDYIASKEINNKTYSNILEISCESTIKAHGVINQSNVTIETTEESSNYFAKGVGPIKMESESCETTTIDSNKPTSECEKTVTEITNQI